ncbi:MAG: NUDIX domain-containing protein [Bacteroidetes bacterium]|jgi:8-oxo-dGTP diphosphatase|nr:NUDIX domain-containing protein [Bacteroidota bacterium]MBK8368554.1 NUDIX domain-containing protein [Bacteroidota bacterium]
MKGFNVRVYGILIHENQVLVSDEHIKGMNITKLPGGGLEYGEGTIECVIREFKEELNLDIEVESHFYTTDFFVNSAFSNNNQVISIYYLVKAKGDFEFKIASKPFDFAKKKDGAQSMRWVDLAKISENDFTFVIDKRIGDMLNNNWKNLF